MVVLKIKIKTKTNERGTCKWELGVWVNFFLVMIHSYNLGFTLNFVFLI